MIGESMIEFRVDKEIGTTKIATWADCNFIDGEEGDRPIKKVTLEIESGKEAFVTVERYVNATTKDGHGVFTLNDDLKEELLTHKELYYVKKEDLDVVLNLKRAVFV